jgi:potassium efflux system protein
VIFYFIDQVRIVIAPLQILPRLLFLLEMLGAALFAAWLVGFARRRPSRAVPATAGPGTDSPGAPAPVQVEPSIMSKIVRRGSYAAFAIAIVAFAANGLGYVALANLLGNTLFVSAYVALMLYAVVQILDALLMLSLHLPPLTLLGAVRRHRGLLRRRLRKFMRWLGVGLWLLFALDHLALRERLFRTVRDALTAELDVGALSISLADVLAFAACVWAAYLVSRFVRFLLEEDVYPRVRLTRGLPYAISTILNYTILVVGFLTGVAALGFDMTKFTILAGAFSIGVGFGLQNIFNNFVSGLILLFERPVKVGDVVEIDGTAGVVDRIGIGASTIRSSNGSEFIVPNGKLISERVVNWTFSSRQRSLQLSISVVIGSDLKQVIAVLERVARNHPMVLDNPPPKALVVRMGPDFLGLELHAWTDEVDRWMDIRSDLAVAAGDALAAEKIAVR